MNHVDIRYALAELSGVPVMTSVTEGHITAIRLRITTLETALMLVWEKTDAARELSSEDYDTVVAALFKKKTGESR